MLIPVHDDPELLEWLDEFGLRQRGRALRYPTLGELRAAARSTHPAEIGGGLRNTIMPYCSPGCSCCG